MKKNILIKGLMMLACTGMMTSCASDYLDVQPEASFDAGLVHTTIDGASSAMIGVYRSMYSTYSGWDYVGTGVCGEPWVQTYYGDGTGVDAFYYLWAQYGISMMDWSYNTVNTYWMCSVGWSYYYNLINQCNEILSGLDTMTDGTDTQRKALKAQALTVRSHAYVRLLQLYAPRWADADNGEKYVIVLRTKPGTEDAPLAKEKDVLDNIYTSLDEALKLFDESNYSRKAIYEVNKHVAQGIYARAALLKDDWQTAYDMAKAARVGFPIMTADQYKNGFVEANSEYMWSNGIGTEMYVGYWSWGSMYACTGAYATFAWNTGAGAINYDLYRQMDEKDIRRDLYWTPENIPASQKTLKPANFWNNRYVNTEDMNCNDKNAIMRLGTATFNASFKTLQERYGRMPYSNQAGSVDGQKIVFGAQYKFWGEGIHCDNQFPFMRAAEMALYEAEAAYHLSKITEAQTALSDINSKRISGYSCTKTGQDLLDEIMLTSRVELWGEGHSWFNQKRWNVTVERRPWVAGDVNSNNIPENYKLVKKPSDRGWIFTIPQNELQVNHGIDQSLLIVQGDSEADANK